MIPKKIFQTHEYSYEDLPEFAKQISLSWQRLNPGWVYTYHDKHQREEYVSSFSPELFKIYQTVTGMYQADIWRYLILKNEGGVYADMDSFCITPMDYLFQGVPDHIDLISTEIEKGNNRTVPNHTNNANFAAVKNSQILDKVIKSILDEYDRVNNASSRFIIHDAFSNIVFENQEIVSPTMRANHGHTYKRQFDQSTEKIDYYGQEMTYPEFLSNHGMV